MCGCEQGPALCQRAEPFVFPREVRGMGLIRAAVPAATTWCSSWGHFFPIESSLGWIQASYQAWSDHHSLTRCPEARDGSARRPFPQPLCTGLSEDPSLHPLCICAEGPGRGPGAGPEVRMCPC